MTSVADLPEPDQVAACLVALAHLPGVGPATLLHCHRREGAVAAWDAAVAGHPKRIVGLAEQLERLDLSATTRLVRAARERDPAGDLARHRASGRRVLVHGLPGYPERLLGDVSPPALLFAEGHSGLLERPTVAIVGTRNATRPGRELAEAMGEDLAAAGVVVVSGLALGIDGSAHRGALAAGPNRSVAAAVSAPGVTGAGTAVAAAEDPPVPAVAVIASGLDVAYPRRHADLHRQIAAHGLLLSETPLGSRPVAWRFPARNRILAGLADALVVVESRATGGSMLTVSEALDRGVPVMAVPGHPSAPAAAGTNELLYDGAGPVRDAADVLRALGLDPPRPSPPPGRPARPVHPGHRAVLDAIGTSPSALAEVVARSGRSLEDVSAALAALEGEGWITRVGGWYEPVDPGGRRSQGGRS